jgi:enoyl-CoA hydratase/carnithine racemase
MAEQTSSASDERKITIERRGHLLLIGINRPRKRNAFDGEMLGQLAAAFAELEHDRELRCGVIFAHGDHFTAGLDLADVGPRIASGELDLGAFEFDPMAVHGPTRSKPTVIAVQGICLTIGVELSLAQDICIAASNTRFGQIEVRRGIMPFGGATFRLLQRAGWGNAMRWLLTGDEFDAAEALRIGLAQEVVEVGHQLERAIEIAQTIAAQAPLAVQASLAAARRALAQQEQAGIAALMPEVHKLMRSEDAAEGMMSFIERRTANFKGK